jgi:hypothetical protein
MVRNDLVVRMSPSFATSRGMNIWRRWERPRDPFERHLLVVSTNQRRLGKAVTRWL